VSAEVLWSGTDRIVYSGDTLRVEIRVRNRGPLPSDTSTYVLVSGTRSFGGGLLELGSIGVGVTIVDTLAVEIPLVRHDTASNDALDVDVYSWLGDDVDGNNRIRLGPFEYRPTYMRLSGPDTIRVGQPNDFNLRIIHPAPHPLHAASIGVCFEAPQCRGGVLIRVAGPTVAPRSSMEIPLRVAVPMSPSLIFPQGGFVSACYGYPGISSECGWKRVVLLPPT